MKFYTFAATVLALGFVSSTAFAAHGGPGCSDIERKNAGFVDCMHNGLGSRSQSPAAAVMNPGVRHALVVPSKKHGKSKNHIH